LRKGLCRPELRILTLSATLEDIALRAGLSVSTVSRILNNIAGKHRISKETEKRVLKAAADLKYRPNQLARGLRLKKTQTIGLILPDISNPFFAYVTRSIQSEVHKQGYSLVVCDTDEDLVLEVEHTNLLIGKGVDGLIVMPVGQRAEHLERLSKEGIPYVLVDRCFDDIKTSSVVVDNYRGSYDAVEFLIKHGHKRIGIIQGLPNTFTTKGRLQGYLDALTAHHLPIDFELIVGHSFRKETGYVETKFLLSKTDRPTAIFATGDLLTLGALQAIYESGLTIPDDVSLVAFDEIDFNAFLRCPLTTVWQPKENMGELAVKLLVEAIKTKGRREPKQIVLSPRLVPGGSVKRIPAQITLAVTQ